MSAEGAGASTFLGRASDGIEAHTPQPPDIDPKAEFDRAVLLHTANRLVEAEQLYRRILAWRPRHARIRR